MTILMDGKKLRDKKLDNLKHEIHRLNKSDITPHLVVLLVGEDPASKIYVRIKRRTCENLGIKSTEINLPKDVSYEELKKVINRLNNDEDVNAILVQFPLPSHLSKKAVEALIDPSKDVDGVNPFNQGVNNTLSYHFAPKPCTPNGIMELLKEYKIDLSGKNVLIIGRSNIVGKPMNYLMTNANATVTNVHSKTRPEFLKLMLANADVIISASGAQDIFTPEMVKQDVVIVDVGIIRKPDGKLRGDIEYKKFMDKASYITPVPGGVGPMTIAMLMENVIVLTKNQKNQ